MFGSSLAEFLVLKCQAGWLADVWSHYLSTMPSDNSK